MSIECPEGQYPYGGCSTCFSVVEQARDFDSAVQNCQQQGGQLLTIKDLSQFVRLGRYLEGLREDRQLWVGYRYSSDGSRVDIEGQVAPAVVSDDGSFVGTASGNQQTCIGVRGFSLLSVSCDQSLSSICMFTYGGELLMFVITSVVCMSSACVAFIDHVHKYHLVLDILTCSHFL